MIKKTTSIPVNDFGDEFVSGISIEKIVSGNLTQLTRIRTIGALSLS